MRGCPLLHVYHYTATRTAVATASGCTSSSSPIGRPVVLSSSARFRSAMNTDTPSVHANSETSAGGQHCRALAAHAQTHLPAVLGARQTCHASSAPNGGCAASSNQCRSTTACSATHCQRRRKTKEHRYQQRVERLRPGLFSRRRVSSAPATHLVR